MKSLSSVLVLTFVYLAGLVPAAGLDSAAADPRKALLEDAASYAEIFSVSFDEAVRRLELQGRIGELEAALARDEAASFAGLWIEHEPEFRIVVRFTDTARSRNLSLLRKGSFDGQLEVRSARWSLAELEKQQARARELAKALGTAVDSDIDLFENRVVLYAVDEPGLVSSLSSLQLELPAGVEVIGVDRLAATQQLEGGESLTTCTAAFGVRGVYGEMGISTAAHCGNAQSAQGVALDFRSEDQQGNQDVQWHSACDLLDVSNHFNSGLGSRACTGTRHRDQQAVGSLVCKWGKTTGRTCGTIQSKSFAPSYVTSAASTFVRVDGGSTNLSEPGDSGGPWFVESLAYGVHSGSPGDDANDAIYMPINYISSLGVSVLTSDPAGPGCTICVPSGGLCARGIDCCSSACVPLGLGGLRVCS